LQNHIYDACAWDSAISVITYAYTELIKVDEWMRLHKLSINYAKSMYFLTGKSFTKVEEEKKNFKLHIKNVVLHRKTFVKYLGVLLDESLNRTTHVKYL